MKKLLTSALLLIALSSSGQCTYTAKVNQWPIAHYGIQAVDTFPATLQFNGNCPADTAVYKLFNRGKQLSVLKGNLQGKQFTIPVCGSYTIRKNGQPWLKVYVIYYHN